MRLSAPAVPVESGRPAAKPALQAWPPVVRVEEARQPGCRAEWLRHVPVVAAATLVMAVAAIVTGANLFGSPHYESDEGTYVASAWSMFEQGKLAYYTYNYDHPPFGWFVIGLWAKLVGGFLAFGTSIDTARVLMVLVASASTLLIFLIVRAATGRLIAAVSAGVIFAVSPLGIDLHRQVWLDNLAACWLLVSVYLLILTDDSMGKVLASAVAFGLAFWTKEISAVCLPAMLGLVVSHVHPGHRRFAVAVWVSVALACISLFVLLAILKDELLPPGMLWSSADPHVSLLETYRWQAARPGNGSILSPESDFRRMFDQWWRTDPVLILAGIGASVAALPAIRRLPLLGSVAMLALSFLAFLARGGVVLYYYVIPVLALFAVVLGLVQGYAAQLLHRLWRPLGHAVGPVVLALVALWSGMAVERERVAFTAHPTAAQDEAADWIIRTLPHDSTILMDSYAWVEVRDRGATDGRPFWNAHYYWPAVSDPAIRDGVLHGDWHSIDYLAVSPSIEADLARRDLAILPEALQNADEVQTFFTDQWKVRILRVRKLQETAVPDDSFLTDAWATYKDRFINSGRVVDPATGQTTSEGQSYALLQSVYVDDRATFDQLWAWTTAHLQTRDGDALLAWKWGVTPDAATGVLDSGSATDADEDTALALLFASRRWDAPAYQAEAVRMLQSIWDVETTMVAGRRVVVAGNWARGDQGSERGPAMINPSYFAPYAYRIFAEADPSHPWQEIVDSTYDVLARVRAAPEFGGSAGLVPDWLALDPTTGELQSADALGPNWSHFSYDASRLPWRLALDWLWFQDERSKEALAGLDLPRREVDGSNRLVAAYRIDGTPAVEYEALSMYAGTLGGLLVGQDRGLAHRIFAERIVHSYHNEAGLAYWGDITTYYDQNWAWFATALMDGGMANLWAGETVLNWDKVLP